MSAELAQAFAASHEVSRWKAEGENASARLELARAKESRALLLSGREPVASLGVDRGALRILLSFTVHHDRARLQREVAAFVAARAAAHG